MSKIRWMVWGILSVAIAACGGPATAPVPLTATATPTAVASPTIPPAATPVATATPLPAPSPTPAGESRWQCDPSGGVACFSRLSYVKMLSAAEGWATDALSPEEAVLHYTDQPGGAVSTWQWVTPSSAITPFRSLDMVSPTEGWAITGEGAYFMHYKDGQWEVKSERGAAQALDMLSPTDGWAVGSMGIIYHYTQGEWQEAVHTTRGQPDLATLAMLNARDGWAAGSNNTLLHYDGQKWQPVGEEGRPYFVVIIAMEAVSETEIWAVGDGIYHYKDGVWQKEDAPYLSGIYWGLSMVSADEGWAIQEDSLFHYYHGEWQKVANPSKHHLRSIDMIDADEGWAVGANGTMLHYQNGKWEVFSEGQMEIYMSDLAWLGETDEGWGVGAAKKLYHYQHGQWQLVDSPTDVSPAAIDMVNPEEGWAVGWDGAMLHYAQGRWQLAPSVVSQDLTDVDLFGDHTGLAVGQKGVILRYRDGVWLPMSSPTQEWLFAVAMAGEQEAWVVGRNKTFLHYQNGQWETMALSDKTFVDVQMFGETAGWMFGGSALLRYRDGQWQEVPLPQGSTRLSMMGMLSADEGWFMDGDRRGRVWHYKAGVWEKYDTPPIGVAVMRMVNENEGWAVGDGILHYTNK